MKFNIVFRVSATTRIKLVLKAFTARNGGFRYGYHVDAHTSFIEMPELASEVTCRSSNTEVEIWLMGLSEERY